LRKYTANNKGSIEIQRKYLFIDERPGLVPTITVTDRMMNDCISHARKQRFKQAHIDEIITVKEQIGRLLGGAEDFEYIDDSELQSTFRLSSSFKQAWRKNPPSDENCIEFPNWVDDILEKGKSMENTTKTLLEKIVQEEQDNTIQSYNYDGIELRQSEPVILRNTLLLTMFSTHITICIICTRLRICKISIRMIKFTARN